MASKDESYVDTSALVAFFDRSDTYHPLFRRLFSQPPPLFTTPLVIAEGHGWFLRRFDRSRAMQFLAGLEAMTPLAVTAVGAREHAGAAKEIRRFSDQDLTLTDGLGLYMMRVRDTKECWSTDFHLGLTGVPLVIQR
jgi:predicted nucleic acid-binding protein